VLVYDEYGFSDVIAEFDSRERAERFASKLREDYPKLKLEVVEVSGYEIPSSLILMLIIGVIAVPVALSLLLRWERVV